MKKYAVHPGWVGDKWLSFDRLVELYGVQESECFDWDDPVGEHHYPYPDNLIHLYPREDGVYHSPEKTEAQK